MSGAGVIWLKCDVSAGGLTFRGGELSQKKAWLIVKPVPFRHTQNSKQKLDLTIFIHFSHGRRHFQTIDDVISVSVEVFDQILQLKISVLVPVGPVMGNTLSNVKFRYKISTRLTKHQWDNQNSNEATKDQGDNQNINETIKTSTRQSTHLKMTSSRTLTCLCTCTVPLKPGQLDRPAKNRSRWSRDH